MELEEAGAPVSVTLIKPGSIDTPFPRPLSAAGATGRVMPGRASPRPAREGTERPLHPHDARQLAWDLMRRHGLDALGWRFRFDNARRRFGSCRLREKVITLSRTLSLLNPESQVRDTVLHEIAHALTPGDGHGPAWKARCARIGAQPRRCYDDVSVVSPPRKAAPYRYGCRPCGWWVERRRIVSCNYVCARCRGPLLYEVKATGQVFRVRAVRQGRRRLRICELVEGEMQNAE